MQNFLPIAGVATFALGVGTRTLFDISLPAITWGLFLSLVVGLVWRRKSGAFSAPYLLTISVILLTFSLGLIRTEMHSWQFGNSLLANQLEEKAELTGVVVAEPDIREKTVQMLVTVGADKVLVSTDRLANVKYGDEILIKGKLEKPTNFVTDMGRTFDYVNYLKAKGVEYSISFAEIEVISVGHGNFILENLLGAKHIFIDSIKRVIPEPAVGLGSGLLLGVKSALGEDIENDFRRTGIIHIVVLSGYNVMLVVSFILFCFSSFMSLRWRVIAGIVAIVAFALIVGLSATVVRASIMAGLVLLAQLWSRQYDVMRALLLAGVIMILINPYILIYDIGFQLSFMATLGLLLIIPHFEVKILAGKNLFGIKEFFLATCATQIAVLPLLMYHIGEVSLIAVVVNVLVLPVVPVAMLLTFITGVFGLFSVSLASLVGYLANFVLNYILVIAGWFADVPFAAVAISTFSTLSLAISYGVLTILYFCLTIRNSNSDNYFDDWVIKEEAEEKADVAANKIQLTYRP